MSGVVKSTASPAYSLPSSGLLDTRYVDEHVVDPDGSNHGCVASLR